jgi:hypothetical protein
MNLRYVSNIPRLVAAYTCSRYLWNRYSKPRRWLAMDALYYGLRHHATIYLHIGTRKIIQTTGKLCRIWGSHNGGYEEFCLLEYNAI